MANGFLICWKKVSKGAVLIVNKFIDGITVALHTEFGDEYKYYVEDVEQNVSYPCFVVGMLNPLIRSKSTVKYDRTMPVVIHYFTDKENTLDAKKDDWAIAERLIESLEYLSIDGLLFRGENIEWEIVEDVLEFFITYNFEIRKYEDPIYMEDGFYNDEALPKP